MSSFALWSVPVAVGLAYAPHFLKVIILTSNSAYDNTDPRPSAAQKTALSPQVSALAKRLASSHQNQLELLGVYAAGIAAGTAVGLGARTLRIIAGLYIGARGAYNIAYAAPQVAGGLFRTLSFVGSMASTITLWSLSAVKLAEKSLSVLKLDLTRVTH